MVNLTNMSLNQVYGKGKDKSVVTMDIQEFIDEHKNLIEILREGSREELLAEAEEQENELDECMKEHGITESED
jgi:hypothetical protein